LFDLDSWQDLVAVTLSRNNSARLAHRLRSVLGEFHSCWSRRLGIGRGLERGRARKNMGGSSCA
jgi:hypothetical protein